MKTNIIIYVTFIAFVSCKRVAEPLPISGPNYYPLEVGKYITYLVREYNHDAFLEKSDTAYYWQKELIESSFIDNSGSLVYKLEISRSQDSGVHWAFASFAIVEKDEFSAKRTENNQRKTVLSFPLRDRKTWNVNELNTLDYQRAKVDNLDKIKNSLLGSTFTQTVSIDLGNDVDIFFSNIESEVYASGIGLIERTYVNTETQPDKFKNGIEQIKTIYETNW